jgi:hypothetical protein
MDTHRIQPIRVRYTRVITFIAVVGMLLAACQSGAPSGASASSASGGLQVEVIYLNHPPVRPIIQEIDQLLAGYGAKVSETKYDFGTTAGAAFAKKKGITGHTPLAIFIGGSESFDLNGRNVKFESFPQGEGTGMVPDGAWTMADLKSILDTKVAK